MATYVEQLAALRAKRDAEVARVRELAAALKSATSPTAQQDIYKALRAAQQTMGATVHDLNAFAGRAQRDAGVLGKYATDRNAYNAEIAQGKRLSYESSAKAPASPRMGNIYDRDHKETLSRLYQGNLANAYNTVTPSVGIPGGGSVAVSRTPAAARPQATSSAPDLSGFTSGTTINAGRGAPDFSGFRSSVTSNAALADLAGFQSNMQGNGMNRMTSTTGTVSTGPATAAPAGTGVAIGTPATAPLAQQITQPAYNPMPLQLVETPGPSAPMTLESLALSQMPTFKSGAYYSTPTEYGIAYPSGGDGTSRTERWANAMMMQRAGGPNAINANLLANDVTAVHDMQNNPTWENLYASHLANTRDPNMAYALTNQQLALMTPGAMSAYAGTQAPKDALAVAAARDARLGLAANTGMPALASPMFGQGHFGAIDGFAAGPNGAPAVSFAAGGTSRTPYYQFSNTVGSYALGNSPTATSLQSTQATLAQQQQQAAANAAAAQSKAVWEQEQAAQKAVLDATMRQNQTLFAHMLNLQYPTSARTRPEDEGQ